VGTFLEIADSCTVCCHHNARCPVKQCSSLILTTDLGGECKTKTSISRGIYGGFVLDGLFNLAATAYNDLAKVNLRVA
jgi:hypothetical protein